MEHNKQHLWLYRWIEHESIGYVDKDKNGRLYSSFIGTEGNAIAYAKRSIRNIDATFEMVTLDDTIGLIVKKTKMQLYGDWSINPNNISKIDTIGIRYGARIKDYIKEGLEMPI